VIGERESGRVGEWEKGRVGEGENKKIILYELVK
jgi:hypothetical protein